MRVDTRLPVVATRPVLEAGARHGERGMILLQHAIEPVHRASNAHVAVDRECGFALLQLFVGQDVAVGGFLRLACRGSHVQRPFLRSSFTPANAASRLSYVVPSGWQSLLAGHI